MMIGEIDNCTEHKLLPIIATQQFQFPQPKFSFGQQVVSNDGFTGYVVGLDFYPETRIWSYGVYIINQENEFIEENWYEAEQLKLVSK